MSFIPPSGGSSSNLQARISLQDQFSGKLKKAGQGTRTFGSRLKEMTQRVKQSSVAISVLQSAVFTFGGVIGKVAVVAWRFGKTIKRVFGNIVKKAIDSVKQWMKRMYMMAKIILPVLGSMWIHMSKEMEQALRNVTSLLAGAGKKSQMEIENQYKTWRRQLSQMSVKYGVDDVDLAEGLYQVVSATFEGPSAKKVLDVVAKGAAATLTPLETMTSAVTKTLHSFKNESESLEDVAAKAGYVVDQMFMALNRGMYTMPEFVKAWEPMPSMLKAMGVSLEEGMAYFSAISRRGLDLEQAQTGLRAILMSFANMQEASREAAAELFGDEWKQVWSADALAANGLLGVLTELDKKLPQISEAHWGMAEALDEEAGAGAGAKYLTEQYGEMMAAITALFPNVRALRAVLALSGPGLKMFAEDIEYLGVNALGATDRAFAETAKSTQFQLDRLKRAFGEFGQGFGDLVLPGLSTVAETLANWYGDLPMQWGAEQGMVEEMMAKGLAPEAIEEEMLKRWDELNPFDQLFFMIKHGWTDLTDRVNHWLEREGGRETMISWGATIGAILGDILTGWTVGDIDSGPLGPLVSAFGAALKAAWDAFWEKIDWNSLQDALANPVSQGLLIYGGYKTATTVGSAAIKAGVAYGLWTAIKAALWGNTAASELNTSALNANTATLRGGAGAAATGTAGGAKAAGTQAAKKGGVGSAARVAGTAGLYGGATVGAQKGYGFVRGGGVSGARARTAEAKAAQQAYQATKNNADFWKRQGNKGYVKVHGVWQPDWNHPLNNKPRGRLAAFFNRGGAAAEAAKFWASDPAASMGGKRGPMTMPSGWKGGAAGPGTPAAEALEGATKTAGRRWLPSWLYQSYDDGPVKVQDTQRPFYRVRDWWNAQREAERIRKANLKEPYARGRVAPGAGGGFNLRNFYPGGEMKTFIQPEKWSNFLSKKKLPLTKSLETFLKGAKLLEQAVRLIPMMHARSGSLLRLLVTKPLQMVAKAVVMSPLAVLAGAAKGIGWGAKIGWKGLKWLGIKDPLSWAMYAVMASDISREKGWVGGQYHWQPSKLWSGLGFADDLFSYFHYGGEMSEVNKEWHDALADFKAGGFVGERPEMPEELRTVGPFGAIDWFKRNVLDNLGFGQPEEPSPAYWRLRDDIEGRYAQSGDTGPYMTAWHSVLRTLGTLLVNQVVNRTGTEATLDEIKKQARYTARGMAIGAIFGAPLGPGGALLGGLGGGFVGSRVTDENQGWTLGGALAGAALGMAAAGPLGALIGAIGGGALMADFKTQADKRRDREGDWVRTDSGKIFWRGVGEREGIITPRDSYLNLGLEEEMDRLTPTPGGFGFAGGGYGAAQDYSLRPTGGFVRGQEPFGGGYQYFDGWTEPEGWEYVPTVSTMRPAPGMPDRETVRLAAGADVLGLDWDFVAKREEAQRQYEYDLLERRIADAYEPNAAWKLYESRAADFESMLYPKDWVDYIDERQGDVTNVRRLPIPGRAEDRQLGFRDEPSLLNPRDWVDYIEDRQGDVTKIRHLPIPGRGEDRQVGFRDEPSLVLAMEDTGLELAGSLWDMYGVGPTAGDVVEEVLDAVPKVGDKRRGGSMAELLALQKASIASPHLALSGASTVYDDAVAMWERAYLPTVMGGSAEDYISDVRAAATTAMAGIPRSMSTEDWNAWAASHGYEAPETPTYTGMAVPRTMHAGDWDSFMDQVYGRLQLASQWGTGMLPWEKGSQAWEDATTAMAAGVGFTQKQWEGMSDWEKYKAAVEAGEISASIPEYLPVDEATTLANEAIVLGNQASAAAAEAAKSAATAAANAGSQVSGDLNVIVSVTTGSDPDEIAATIVEGLGPVFGNS